MSNYTERFTRLDYCQFLVSSQINYSLTYFAEHAKKWSHDTVNRYLKGEKITPRLVWEKVQPQVEPSEEGYVIFDDTVLDKNHSRKMGAVRRQWSGNAGGVIRGIGVVTCIYVNPGADEFWIIDYRIYDPDADGKPAANRRLTTSARCSPMFIINQCSSSKETPVQGGADGFVVRLAQSHATRREAQRNLHTVRSERTAS